MDVIVIPLRKSAKKILKIVLKLPNDAKYTQIGYFRP